MATDPVANAYHVVRPTSSEVYLFTEERSKGG